MDYFNIIEHGPSAVSFVEPSSHHILYSIDSRRHPQGSSSSIRRHDAGSDVELADVTYFDWSTTRVAFGDRDVELDAFLRRTSTASNSRMFMGPDGKTYKWRIKGKNLELYQLSSHILLAQSQRRSRGMLMGKARPASLYFAPKTFDPQTLDAVVVTFVIMQRLLRDRLKYGHFVTSRAGDSHAS